MILHKLSYRADTLERKVIDVEYEKKNISDQKESLVKMKKFEFYKKIL